MENLLLSLNVVLPLMIYIFIGMALRKFGVATEGGCREISRIVFNLALPALCFSSIMDADFSTMFEDPFILYILGGILFLFVASMLLVPVFCKDNRRRGVLVQSIFRSNDGIFGLAVALALMDVDHIGLMIMCISLTQPLYNILAVLDMEVFRGGRVHIKSLMKNLLTNPLFIGCILAVALNLLHVTLPEVLSTTISRIGSLSAPVGFIALGGTLSFASVRHELPALGLVSVLRLIVSPLLLICAMYLLGYRSDHLLVTMIIFGAPTAMSTYPMACAMNGDEQLASGMVTVTSVLSIFTIFLFIFVLKQMGMI